MYIHVVFAVKAPSLDDACPLVEKALGVTFEPRYSVHRGGDYFLCEQPGVQWFCVTTSIFRRRPEELDFPDARFSLSDEQPPISATLLGAPACL